jgi:hypothetical protein
VASCQSWLILVLLLGLPVRVMRHERRIDSTASKAATQQSLNLAGNGHCRNRHVSPINPAC